MLRVNSNMYKAMYGNIVVGKRGSSLCSCACNCSCHCMCRCFRPDDGSLEW